MHRRAERHISHEDKIAQNWPRWAEDATSEVQLCVQATYSRYARMRRLNTGVRPSYWSSYAHR